MVVEKEEQCLVKKRVLYIGTSVPLETSDGLEAIQKPLRDRYPVEDDAEISGLDAWVSILPSGLRLEYVEDRSTVTHFPISSLNICAAVRKVRNVNAATGEVTPKFVSLTSHQAASETIKNPAVFTAITRRTSGRRVLECHGFVCLNDRDALDLVKATKYVDGIYKRNGTIPTPRSSQIYRETRTSGGVPNGVVNGVNGHTGSIKREPPFQDGSYNVRLVPGDAIESVQNVAPEFYDTVPTQGYFYSTPRTEVKKFNVERLNDKAHSDIGPVPRRIPTARPPPPMSARGFPPRATLVRPLPRPAMPVVMQRRPHFVGPPPPRPRFFSPPPMMHRPMYGPPPPAGPQSGPMFMPYPPQPIFVRRPRPRSHSSGSKSPDKESSRDSSPRNENTSPKRMNGDVDTDSDISAARPKTPPRDYDGDVGGPVKQRMSRRDQYERTNRRSESPRRRTPPRYINPAYQPFMHPYYGMPMHPAFMYQRSRSVPPPMRYPTEDKKSKKSKRNKKKGKKKNRRAPSDISNESFEGYTSELPFGAYPPPGPFDQPPRRPRDFRREENQFLNERSFSKRIQEENRTSKGGSYPTAYELNDAHADERIKDSEFTMY